MIYYPDKLIAALKAIYAKPAGGVFVQYSGKPTSPPVPKSRFAKYA